MSGVRRSVGRALDSVRGDGRGWVVLAVAVGWFFTLGLRFVVPAFVPQIRAAFDVGNAGAGVVVTALWLPYAAMQFPAGVLVDRFDPRRVLTASLLLSAASVVALGVVPGFALFLVACAAFGLGSGLYGTTRAVALSAAFRRNPGVAFGATLAAGSLGAAGLPVAATVLADAVGWQRSLAVAGPAFLLTAALAWRVVPDDTGVSERAPLADGLRAVRTPTVVLAVAAMTLMLFVFQGLTAFLPAYLVDAKGLEQGTAAALYGGLFVSGAAFQLAMGRAADRFGYPRTLLAIAALSVPPLVVLPFAAGVPLLVVLVVAMGLRLAAGPVNNAFVVGVLPDEVRGTAWGFLRTVFFAVGSTGSVVVGAMADRGSFDAAFLLLAALTAVAAAIYVALLRYGNR